LDSTRKKIAFVASAIESLTLENARAIAERSETFGQTRGERERYDVATLRAIGSAVVCAEYALPLVKVGGRVILYRGQWTEAETEALSEVAAMLGGAIASIDSFKTPLTYSIRHAIVLEKRSPTPKAYPRLPGIPNRHPLGSEPQR
ncbi:MAG: RsmG family class I SAM-dependent methyltransferase, partial [Cyanobacteria bacterium J06648_11]